MQGYISLTEGKGGNFLLHGLGKKFSERSEGSLTKRRKNGFFFRGDAWEHPKAKDQSCRLSFQSNLPLVFSHRHLGKHGTFPKYKWIVDCEDLKIGV